MWSSALLILSTRCHSTERQSSVLTIRMYNRSEEHTSELQSPYDFVCRLLLEKKKALISGIRCTSSCTQRLPLPGIMTLGAEGGAAKGRGVAVTGHFYSLALSACR